MKYSSIRFYDADKGDGEFYRIRSDHFTWDERRGWAASCDKFLSEDPATDPLATSTSPTTASR